MSVLEFSGSKHSSPKNFLLNLSIEEEESMFEFPIYSLNSIGAEG